MNSMRSSISSWFMAESGTSICISYFSLSSVGCSIVLASLQLCSSSRVLKPISRLRRDLFSRKELVSLTQLPFGTTLLLKFISSRLCDLLTYFTTFSNDSVECLTPISANLFSYDSCNRLSISSIMFLGKTLQSMILSSSICIGNLFSKTGRMASSEFWLRPFCL